VKNINQGSNKTGVKQGNVTKTKRDVIASKSKFDKESLGIGLGCIAMVAFLIFCGVMAWRDPNMGFSIAGQWLKGIDYNYYLDRSFLQKPIQEFDGEIHSKCWNCSLKDIPVGFEKRRLLKPVLVTLEQRDGTCVRGYLPITFDDDPMYLLVSTTQKNYPDGLVVGIVNTGNRIAIDDTVPLKEILEK
jgi:hypothetical protein